MRVQGRRTAVVFAGALLTVLTLTQGVSLTSGVDPAEATVAAATARAAGEVEQPVRTYAVPFRPIRGGVFNNPLGTSEEQRRVLAYVVKTVDATPNGAVIRASLWALGDRALLWALQRAHARGVDVRMVIDGHRESEPALELQSALGSDPSASSYLVFCKSSCRGERGQNHTKFFMFSESGGKEAVTLVTSANATGYNVDQLWNDLYSLPRSRAVYDTFFRVFEQMKRDTPVSPSHVSETTARGFLLNFYPFPKATDVDDPTLRILDKVTCLGATDGTGVGRKGRAKIRIAMSAWHGNRGLAAARQLAALQERGCRTRVILGSGSGKGVRTILTSGGIKWRMSSHKKVHTHQKLLLISGVYEKNTHARRVFTGSHNWTDRSLLRDEVVLGIPGRRAHRDYEANWTFIWNNG